MNYSAGNPDAGFWPGVPAYRQACSKDVGGLPDEGATVRFAWNERGLFVHAELEDSHVVATHRCDEQLHFETGDVFELFVKPAGDEYYWEMYATPYGNKSTLFFPSDREGMEVGNFLNDHAHHGLEVRSRLTESGWEADLFVPAGQLAALGEAWGPPAQWTVLCGRYNYNNNALEHPELSMFPPVSKTNYHLTAEYAVLKFRNPSEGGAGQHR